MMPELELWQQVSLFALALISLVYVYYFRIWVALATGSDLLFVAALAVCVASIAIPRVFDEGARRLVDASPLPAALADADTRVADLEALPSRLIDHALEKIGYEREVDDEDEVLLPVTAGPFESHVRPAVEALVSLVLRAGSFVCSFFLLLMALALRSSTSTARELDKLSTRVERLPYDDVEGQVG